MLKTEQRELVLKLDGVLDAVWEYERSKGVELALYRGGKVSEATMELQEWLLDSLNQV